MHIGHAKVAASVMIGELFVVDTQKMQDGGVQIVNVNFVPREVSLLGSEPLLKRKRDVRSMNIREAFPGRVDSAAWSCCICSGSSTR